MTDPLVLGEGSLETLKKFSRVIRLARRGHHGAWRQQVGGEEGVENKPLKRRKPQSGLTPADAVKVLSHAERTSNTHFCHFFLQLPQFSCHCMSTLPVSSLWETTFYLFPFVMAKNSNAWCYCRIAIERNTWGNEIKCLPSITKGGEVTIFGQVSFITNT